MSPIETMRDFRQQHLVSWQEGLIKVTLTLTVTLTLN